MIFLNKVLDRFRNPYIDHAWLSITLQYSSKMNMRNLPSLLNYYQQNNTVPVGMALGFAAHIFFMRSERKESGKYEGIVAGKSYGINDDRAEIYSSRWADNDIAEVVHATLADKDFWGADLSVLPGFEKAGQCNLQLIINSGAKAAIKSLFR
ncbi:MAG: hypothetical protein QM764_19290 [Chitinophagaceae bacterium]